MSRFFEEVQSRKLRELKPFRPWGPVTFTVDEETKFIEMRPDTMEKWQISITFKQEFFLSPKVPERHGIKNAESRFCRALHEELFGSLRREVYALHDAIERQDHEESLMRARDLITTVSW